MTSMCQTTKEGGSLSPEVTPPSSQNSEFPVRLKTGNSLADVYKMTASNDLLCGVLKGRLRKIKLLLDRGMNINGRNDYGYNVLVAALHVDNDAKRDKMFRILLQRGANVLARDSHNDRGVLSWACLLGRAAQVDLILEDFGGEINLTEQDQDGFTPLHHATCAGNIQIIRTLISSLRKYELSVDVADRNGMTPFTHARRLGLREVAEVLRTEGLASPARADATFRSPREWSQIGKFERQQNWHQQRREEINRAKVYGRINKVRALGTLPRPIIPRLDVPHSHDQSALDNQRQSTPASSKYEEQIFDSELSDNPGKIFLDVPADLVKSARSTPERLRHRSVDNSFDVIDGLKVPKKGSSRDAISLLGLSGREKGHTPSQFYQSQFDTSKRDEYKDMLGSLNTIMTILSQEQSPSFRKPVIMQIPEPPKPTKEKPKVSTLAIILGKGQNPKNVRKKRKLANDTKKRKDAHREKKDSKQRGKPQKQSVLPDIRVNDRNT